MSGRQDSYRAAARLPSTGVGASTLAHIQSDKTGALIVPLDRWGKGRLGETKSLAPGHITKNWNQNLDLMTM